MQFELESHQLFYDHWSSLREADEIPNRSAMRPELIPSLLADMVIMHWIDESELIYSLVGSAVVRRMGVDVTGKNFYAVSPPETASFLSRQMKSVMDTPCGLQLAFETRGETGRINKISGLTLPMRSEEGIVDRLVTVNHAIDTSEMVIEEGLSIGSKVTSLEFLDLGFGVPE